MTELRSFIIGVTIAAAVLGIAAVVFGAFSDGDDDSPSVVLLSTPPASRTPAPATTSVPQPTNTPDSDLPVVNGGEETPQAVPTESEAEPTATQEIAPTQAPTPAGPTVDSYLGSAGPLTQSLAGQLSYLIGNAQNPAVGDSDWQTFTLQAAQNVQSLAASVSALAAPDCMASAQSMLAAGVNQASAAAAELIAAVNAGDANAASASAGSLSAASDAINAGVGAVNSASC